jgi:hypothetical protein
MHSQLSVIFWVNIPSKNHIPETTKAIGLSDQKLGVSCPSKGRPYGLHIKKTRCRVGSSDICEKHKPLLEFPFQLWCSFFPHSLAIKMHT